MYWMTDFSVIKENIFKNLSILLPHFHFSAATEKKTQIYAVLTKLSGARTPDLCQLPAAIQDSPWFVGFPAHRTSSLPTQLTQKGSSTRQGRK